MDESRDTQSERADPPLDDETLRAVYHSVNDAIFVHDAETGEIVDVNDTMCEMYGYTRERARQLTVGDLSSGEPPYTQDNAVEYVRRAAEGESRVFEWRAEDSDGDRFWVEVSMRRASVDGEPLVLATVREVTERKAYEKRLKEQRDNLETLNQVVRHDIRNDLQLVQAHAELCKEHVDEEGLEHLRSVEEGARNAVELTRTARQLAEVMLRADVETRRVSLTGKLEGQLSEVRTEYPEAVIEVDGSLPRVDVTGNEMLGSVFRNLLQNAVQHNDKEVPEVTVSAETRDGRAVVRVADNGPGVADEQKEEVFGKGETGLDSDGTGLGLYLVRSLVESYGGDVWVEDNDPGGAVFVVELPIAD